MLDAHAPSHVPSNGQASQSQGVEISSTEFHPRQRSVWSSLAQAALRHAAKDREVLLLTMGSNHRVAAASLAASHVWMTERNESVSARVIPIRNPNGKDKLKSGVGLLLMTPNTPEITPSADEPRLQSVAADGQVMDRGAEGAAGGCDAI
jgi:hypothetical protein